MKIYKTYINKINQTKNIIIVPQNIMDEQQDARKLSFCRRMKHRESLKTFRISERE